ncbi:distal membrane-arm assembly complex protein 2 isoform X2 [Vombatus ursinus]|uniref:distal membrane-arm assembly complex protein 2 isoform X2 n=1 Tax=Vombatus ursinus TaxID=29139 RepID=UPI000FFDBB00|nr:distal membrane-arm assembly complex protein 2 isoform X2 [Vombatus ursinus]
MAASRALLRAGCPTWWGGGTLRTLSSQSNFGQGPNPSYDLNPNPGRNPQKGLMASMASRFYDVEQFREWIFRFWSWNLYRKNKVFSYTLKHYGPNTAAAHFVLTQGGAVRFQEQEWLFPQDKNQFLGNSHHFQKLPLEEVDASGCLINYYGLENLVFLPSLRSLKLCGCPYVDDWCLSRLHSLGGSLQELSLAGCPKVTERGLACLHHLWNLRRLDISNLPAVSEKGLTRILVEEMLPDCEVVGADYADGLVPLSEDERGVEEKAAAAVPGAPRGQRTLWNREAPSGMLPRRPFPCLPHPGLIDTPEVRGHPKDAGGEGHRGHLASFPHPFLLASLYP